MFFFEQEESTATVQPHEHVCSMTTRSMYAIMGQSLHRKQLYPSTDMDLFPFGVHLVLHINLPPLVLRKRKSSPSPAAVLSL